MQSFIPSTPVRATRTSKRGSATCRKHATLTRRAAASIRCISGLYDALLPADPPFQKHSSTYILLPQKQAKAVVHFISGAFLSPAPHLFYATLLSRLAEHGYVVVAPAFDTRFNQLELAAEVVEEWHAVSSVLKAYADLPVLGVSHSAGGTVLALMASVFEDAPRYDSQLLMAFSNRRASDAIPQYEGLVRPLARWAVSAREGVPEGLVSLVEDAEKRVREKMGRFEQETERVGREMVARLEGMRGVAMQVGGIMREAGGEDVTEFYPGRELLGTAVEGRYAVRRVLLVRFEGDLLDDSEWVEERLRASGTEVGIVGVDGNHLTATAACGSSLDKLVGVVRGWAEGEGT